MATESAPALSSVNKTVTVQADVERAFTVFTRGIDTWWPRSHHIGAAPLAETVIEPRVGGLCYGRSVDGTVCPWGQVLVWEPPARFVMAWQITVDWKHEPDLAKSSEVEVRFTPLDGGGTRVDLEHRHFERHGAGADGMRTAVDSPNGWSTIMQLYTDTTSRQAPPTSVAEVSPATPLALIFRANTALLVKSFDGVGDDQLWHRPSTENNPMLWIAAHMVTTRAAMLKLLGEPVDTGWGDLFARGASLGDESKYPSKADVLRVHADVAGRVQARLRELTADDLAREATTGPKPAGVTTVGEQLGFFALHDSYHLGQLAYIRKALGLSNLVG